MKYEDPLRIALVAPNTVPVPCFDGYGGSERAVYEMGIGLAERGHTIDIYCAEGSKITHPNITRHEFPPSLYDKDFLDGLTGRSITEADLPDLERLSRDNQRQFAQYRDFVARDIKNRRASTDIVHLNLTDAGLIRRIAQTGLPLIVGVHNDVEPGSLPALNPQSSCYTTMSPTHHQRVARGRQGFVQLGAAVGEHQDTGEAGEEVAVFSQDEYLLYVGAISRRKSVATTIDIARKASLPLVIVGPILPWTPAHFQDTILYFRQNIEHFIDQNEVSYFPAVGEAERNRLMRGAIGTIVASGYEDRSWQEPFGRVIAESVLCGTPAIVSGNTGGASWLLRDEVGYIFTDIEDAVQKMASIYRLDKDECRAVATRLFSIDSYIDKLENLMLTKVASGKSKPR